MVTKQTGVVGFHQLSFTNVAIFRLLLALLCFTLALGNL